MDILSSFFEYLNIALGLDPGLVLSIILKTLIITGILLVIIKWLGSKGVGAIYYLPVDSGFKFWKYSW
jgi:hypothetical protein